MKAKLSKFAAATILYAAFALYLFWPHFKNLRPLQYIGPVNLCLAAAGAYILSRRWVVDFWPSFFAGVIYGFAPFTITLLRFHPAATLLAATIPWLFLPAAFGPSGKYRWLRIPLATLPFIAIIAFFPLAAKLRLFAIPTQTRLAVTDLASLIAPLVMAKRIPNIVSFYHIPLAALVIGFAVLIKARRAGSVTILAVAAILAFCSPLIGVSPIIWLTIPTLCCSIIIASGTQTLITAGPADRKWLLISAAVMAALAIVTLLLSTNYFQITFSLADSYAQLFLDSAKMYILGCIATAILFFTARAKLRLHWIRTTIISSAFAVDIFFSARFIIDKTL